MSSPDPGPPKSTARLLLRPFVERDVDDLEALDAEAAIVRILRRYVEHPGLGAWHVTRRDDGRFAGWVSLKHAGESPDIEIGYRLMHHAWGQGFATELATAMLCRGFDDLRLRRIIGVTHPDNAASQRVLLKIGMRDEGWGRYYDRDLRLFAAHRDAERS